MVTWILELIDHCHCKIFYQDEAVTFFVNEELILAYAVFTGTFAVFKITEISGGRKENPVYIVLFGQGIEVELAKRFRTGKPFFGNPSVS